MNKITEKEAERLTVTYADYKVNFKGYEITVPAGSVVTNKTAMGCDDNYHFWNDFQEKAEEITGFKNSILAHDLTYYGLNIPATHCESF